MGAVRRQKKGTGKAPAPSPADLAEQRALDSAVEAMIKGALADWDHTRPLGSLNRQDLAKLASAAISGWVVARSKETTEWDEESLLSDAAFAT